EVAARLRGDQFALRSGRRFAVDGHAAIAVMVIEAVREALLPDGEGDVLFVAHVHLREGSTDPDHLRATLLDVSACVSHVAAPRSLDRRRTIQKRGPSRTCCGGNTSRGGLAFRRVAQGPCDVRPQVLDTRVDGKRY